MPGIVRCAAAAAVVLVCLSPFAAAQPPETMLRWVPEYANAVLVVNVQGLNASQLGQREGWAMRREMDFLAGAARIPPSVNLAVMATEFCFDTSAKDWEVGILRLDRNIPMTDISRREGSTISIIGGERAIYSPRNAIFVELERRVLGVRQPADRQETAQWLQAVRAMKPRDTFLTELVQRAGAQPQVFLAVDLREFRGPEEIVRGLKNIDALGGAKVEAEPFAKFLAGVQSLRLAVTVTGRMDAALHVDFSESPQPYLAALKPLVLSVLGQQGLC